eukprot:TRINITY_DN637_c0_g1_i4.p1 TRINITY_DN637_c0_g1~~TRINITY_DN637_c0_g1_i4.p1  ORF type:complete len:518 (+),score=110.99 TRINITY_DN637_c0_g1_i4:150-1703(+)
MSFLDDARTSLITSVVDPKHEAAPPSSGSHATPPKEHALCCNLLPKQQLWHVAVLVPATAACIVLFAFGQTGNEWGIDLILSSGQDDSNEKTLKQFNLFQSIDALQDENQYGLAALLWVTSVFWPYIKCILTLFIFFAALRWPKLEWALPWVEHLGKWNHVDVIVCYLMMLVIRVKITAQDLEGSTDPTTLLWEKQLLPLAPLPLELQVNGQSGLYLYCTGVCFSMLTGHLIEWMVWSRGNEQSSVVSSMIGDTPRYRHDSTISALQMDDPDEIPSPAHEHKVIKLKLCKLVPSGWKRWLASALLLANAVLFVCCISIDYIYVEYTLPIINRPNKSYSILTGLSEILTMNRDKLSDQAGTHFVGVLLLVFSVVAPASRILIQLHAWMVPTSPRVLRISMIAMEVASAWSGLDVLMLAVGITSVEIGSLTAGLGNKLFDALDLKHVNCDGCIRFDLKIDTGYWYILAHTVASFVIMWWMRKLYDSALHQGDESRDNSFEEEDDLVTLELDRTTESGPF